MTAEACVRMSKETGVGAVFIQLGRVPRVRLPMGRDFLSRQIEELPLSVRSRNALMRAGLDTVDKLTDYLQENKELTGIRNLGRVSINEIKLKLIEAAYELFTEQEKQEFWIYALSN